MFTFNKRFGFIATDRLVDCADIRLRKNNSRGRRQRRRFGSIEQLERRELMAADLTGHDSHAHSIDMLHQPAAVATAGAGDAAAAARANDNTFANAQDQGKMHGIRKFDNRIGPNDPKDFYRFELDDRARVTLRLNGLSADLDLVLYDSEGFQIEYSSRNEANPEKIVEDLEGPSFYNTGVYYVGVMRGSSGEKSDQSSYRLTIDVDIAGETIAKAVDLGIMNGQWSYTDWVGQGDKNDYFRFQMDHRGQFNLRLDPKAADLDLFLYNAAGQLIGSSSRAGTADDIIQLTLGAGTYYAQVTPLGAAQSDYRLAFDVPWESSPLASSDFRISLLMSGLNIHQQTFLNAAARHWELAIVGDLPDKNYLGQVVDDILIEVKAEYIDGVPTNKGNVLAKAGPNLNALRSGSNLPYHGVLTIDTTDLDSLTKSGKIYELVNITKHEIGHVLGFGTLWEKFNLLEGKGSSDPRFKGKRATAEFKILFGDKSATGVPVETEGGKETRDTHWRENLNKRTPLFGGELMSGFAGPDPYWAMSRITIASFADMGYKVNFKAAERFITPSRAAIASAASSSTGNNSRASLRANSDTGAAQVGNLSPGLADLAITAGAGNATSRPAMQASSPRVAFPVNSAQFRVACAAAIDAWVQDSKHGDFENEMSEREARAAFDSAWNDLAGKLFDAAVA
jgi:hypothetical protein